jgi:hypothetical protein
MKPENKPFQNPGEKKPNDILQDFVSVFTNKGWLNRTLRIKRCERRYRICCNESEFFAYRINDHGGVPPGFPGWPVCIVTPRQIIEDSKVSPFPSTEPGVYDWLRCMAEDDFELL